MGSGRALRRLYKDYEEIKKNPLPTVFCEPEENNFFVWHVNLVAGEDTGYAGGIFHLIVTFPDDYPNSPPRVIPCTPIYRSHVYGTWICLDMLIPDHFTNEMYRGWSTGYSALSILLQLQAYLFDEDESWGAANEKTIRDCIRKALEFKCTTCPHNMKQLKPFPFPSHLKIIKTKVEEKNSMKTENEKRITIIPNTMIKKQEEESKIEMITQNESEPKEIYQRSINFSNANKQLLPDDIVYHEIFSYLNTLELLRCSGVCKQWRRLVKKIQSQVAIPVCFHTKMTYKECKIGVGISPKINPYSKKIAYIESPLDMISLDAFMNENVRRGVWREPFTHWMPLYINKEHGKRVWKDFEKSICSIAQKEKFDPWDAADIICKLMNTQIVNVMNGNRHASIKALIGYTQFHRWLIELLRRYPKLQSWINKRVKLFIEDEYYRSKRAEPIIGEFFAILSVSKFTWDDVKKPLIAEIFDRNALWILKKFPELAYYCNPEQRIEKSFEAGKTMNGLIMFHVYFLTNIARPGKKGKSLKYIEKLYDLQNGQPTEIMQDALQKAVFKMQNVNTYEQFFKMINLRVNLKDMNSLLINSMRESARKHYHVPGRVYKTKVNNDDWSPWTKKSKPKPKKYVPTPIISNIGGNLVTMFNLLNNKTDPVEKPKKKKIKTWNTQIPVVEPKHYLAQDTSGYEPIVIDEKK